MKLPQLHVRDLFWLVLVAACLCAWWHDHSWFQTELDRRDVEAMTYAEKARQIARREIQLAKTEMALEQAARRQMEGGLRARLHENMVPSQCP